MEHTGLDKFQGLPTSSLVDTLLNDDPLSLEPRSPAFPNASRPFFNAETDEQQMFGENAANTPPKTNVSAKKRLFP